MVYIVKNLGRLGLLALLIGIGSVGTAESSSGWKAGVARVDTTPRKPVRMAGYASRTAPSQGVAHTLAAKALALADASEDKFVLVTCDIIAFRRAFTNRVTDRVKAKYGLPREDVVLFASHNHAGPSLVFHGSTWPTPFADDIESIIVKAAHEVVKKVRRN
jgi:neutral ceramidase